MLSRSVQYKTVFAFAFVAAMCVDASSVVTRVRLFCEQMELTVKGQITNTRQIYFIDPFFKIAFTWF